GDAVQIWPVWAERARLYIDAMPVLAEEDLERADHPGVERLWVLSLPRAPFFAGPEAPLQARGAVPAGAEQRFGALALRRWDLRGRRPSRLAGGGAERARRHRLAPPRRRAAARRARARVPLRRLLPRPRAAVLPAGVDDAMSDKRLARTMGFLTAAILALTQA